MGSDRSFRQLHPETQLRTGLPREAPSVYSSETSSGTELQLNLATPPENIRARGRMPRKDGNRRIRCIYAPFNSISVGVRGSVRPLLVSA
jgi:hypothetical protein